MAPEQHHHDHKAPRAYSDAVHANFHEAVSAWFLGPQGENAELLKGLFKQAVDLQTQSRLAYHPEDGAFITTAIQESENFQKHQDNLVEQFTRITRLLYDYSIPFFSQRYNGHMSFEMGLPGMLGWVATVMNNPNNVAFEASPITTRLEIDVGRDMCEMLGYDETDENHKPKYWGHIACDGTVANLESIWVARNLKYYPLSLRDAMKPGQPLEFISPSFIIPLPKESAEPKLFSELTLWELLNLPSNTILDIPGRLEDEYGITPTYLDSVLNDFIVQTKGKQAVEAEWQMPVSPRYFISNTKHYSWPKGAALAGLGSKYMEDVPIDIHARINTTILRERLDDCLAHEKPVFAVVAIIGSTEEGCVDPLDEILDLRDEYEKKGLCFLVHADAAWGGYFASMVRVNPLKPKMPINEPDREYVPTATLRKSTIRQFLALKRTDSITIDPHKAGYIPYPAGGLCYRDGRMRYLVTWTAPYIKQSDDGESIGIYGVEGSKPGAPAVAAYLHHQIVGLHQDGHGALLGEVTWSCGRISAHWAAMSVDTDPFIVVPLNPLKAEPDPVGVKEEKEFIRNHILGMSNEALIKNPRAMDELRALGSDLNINAFACNFRINGKANSDVEEANYLNNAIFKRLSITTPDRKPAEIPMFLSATTLKMAEYGVCAKHFKERLELETDSNQDLFVLRNVVMSPFQTAGNFVKQVADIFQKVLEEEMEHVVARNTITPQEHSFVLQGFDPSAESGHAFLVYRPYFYNANSRFQVILSADVKTVKTLHSAAQDTSNVFFVTTTVDTNMSDIAKDGASFEGLVTASHANGGSTPLTRVQISNIRVLKNRALDSRWRDDKYPASTVPFYLYGRDGRFFIEHALVKAPNVQLNAEVALTLVAPFTAEHAAQGLLLSVARSEAGMQPADTMSTRWFAEGKTYNVKVYRDPNPTVAHGPGLVSTIGESEHFVSGTMKIVGAAFVDFDRLNTQEFTGRPSHRVFSYTSRAAHPDTKDEWRKVISAYMFDE